MPSFGEITRLTGSRRTSRSTASSPRQAQHLSRRSRRLLRDGVFCAQQQDPLGLTVLVIVAVVTRARRQRRAEPGYLAQPHVPGIFAEGIENRAVDTHVL